MISPLAYIHPEAVIGKNCKIGPFCYIDEGVVIGDDNVLMNSVTVLHGARIGNGNTFFPGAVISAIPQDLKFRGEESTAEIGDNNIFRENVTVNRGTAAKNRTIVGNDNLLMEGAHVAHDVIVGNHCIIGNTTKIAGEVIIDDFATISACVLIHQFTHIGGYCMVGGGAGISQDVLPYSICARHPAAFYGLNKVGLHRRGFTSEKMDEIHNAYQILLHSGKPYAERLADLKNLPQTPEIQYILKFIEESKRGFTN